MVLGEQAFPVRSEVAAPETRKALPFSRVIWLIASAIEEVGTSTMTSTPSTSYHWRAMLEPTSGLFKWSAETSSTFMPCLARAKSSIARRAATADPPPPMSEYRLDMSDSTPILTTPPEICAWAPWTASAETSASGPAMENLENMVVAPLSWVDRIRLYAQILVHLREVRL